MLETFAWAACSAFLIWLRFLLFCLCFNRLFEPQSQKYNLNWKGYHMKWQKKQNNMQSQWSWLRDQFPRHLSFSFTNPFTEYYLGTSGQFDSEQFFQDFNVILKEVLMRCLYIFSVNKRETGKSVLFSSSPTPSSPGWCFKYTVTKCDNVLK